jgi:DNA-binding NtrC family response regulator
MHKGASSLGGLLPELAAVLDGYSAPSILVDPAYRILAANRAYRELYGAGRRLWHQHCHVVSHGSPVPCDQAGEHCPLQASGERGEPQRVLHVHHTPHGDEHVDVETRPIRNSDGEIVYFVEILRHVGIASASPEERGLVGRSPTFNRMLGLIQRVAASEAAVLLLGESGTGKEMVAQAVHTASARAQRPFVPVDCSGLTESLFESELFGHEKGAFTGAHVRKVGLVEAAHGGTLFLDEIGDIPLPLQVKLLRLLETGTYRRVGSVAAEHADFRLVCATHQDLKSMVENGEFRQDLYYRISAFPITLPALRERKEDLALLVETLLQRIGRRRRLSVDPAAMTCLASYAFPGNIRELRNFLERAALLVDGDTITPAHLPEECRSTETEELGDEVTEQEEILPLDVVEQRYLERVVRHYSGDRRELAAKLGVSERTFYRKLSALQS